MASDGDASQIVRSHAERLKLEKEGQEQQDLLEKIETAVANPKEFSSGVRIGGSVLQTNKTQTDVAQLLQQVSSMLKALRPLHSPSTPPVDGVVEAKLRSCFFEETVRISLIFNLFELMEF